MQKQLGRDFSLNLSRSDSIIQSSDVSLFSPDNSARKRKAQTDTYIDKRIKHELLQTLNTNNTADQRSPTIEFESLDIVPPPIFINRFHKMKLVMNNIENDDVGFREFMYRNSNNINRVWEKEITPKFDRSPSVFDSKPSISDHINISATRSLNDSQMNHSLDNDITQGTSNTNTSNIDQDIISKIGNFSDESSDTDPDPDPVDDLNNTEIEEDRVKLNDVTFPYGKDIPPIPEEKLSEFELDTYFTDPYLNSRCVLYLYNSYCYREKCKRMHMLPKSHGIACSFFIKGYCKYDADTCPYLHLDWRVLSHEKTFEASKLVLEIQNNEITNFKAERPNSNLGLGETFKYLRKKISNHTSELTAGQSAVKSKTNKNSLNKLKNITNLKNNEIHNSPMENVLLSMIPTRENVQSDNSSDRTFKVPKLPKNVCNENKKSKNKSIMEINDETRLLVSPKKERFQDSPRTSSNHDNSLHDTSRNTPVASFEVNIDNTIVIKQEKEDMISSNKQLASVDIIPRDNNISGITESLPNNDVPVRSSSKIGNYSTSSSNNIYSQEPSEQSCDDIQILDKIDPAKFKTEIKSEIKNEILSDDDDDIFIEKEIKIYTKKPRFTHDTIKTEQSVDVSSIKCELTEMNGNHL